MAVQGGEKGVILLVINRSAGGTFILQSITVDSLYFSGTRSDTGYNALAKNIPMKKFPGFMAEGAENSASGRPWLFFKI